jgi:hypothetical protein
MLAPGASVEYALAFLLASDVRSKEGALTAAGAAVVQGVPGYTLGEDMRNAMLLVKPPPGAKQHAMHPLRHSHMSVATSTWYPLK